jgi:hypothetical protein
MNKIITALNSARQEIPSIHKGGKSHHGKYATLDSILDVCTPILSKHKLVIVQTFEGHDLLTTLYHESGEQLTSRLTMIVEKQTSQGLGVAATYSRRYGISALLSLSLDDDTDGNHAPQAQRAAKSDLDMLAGEIAKCKNQDALTDIIGRWQSFKCDLATKNAGTKMIDAHYKKLGESK